MAYEADRVVVELIAKTDQLDAPVKQSATNFDASMNKIAASAGKVEVAHNRMSLAANNNRIALLEMQHVVRGSVDQFAAGAPITQIFAQHVSQVGQAATLSGGAFGRFGAILGGPWGLAATAAIAVIATLIAKHHEQSDSLDDVYAKLVKHKDQTAISQQADDIWSHTLDGLIDRSKKLNEQLEKRLQTQTDLQQQQLSAAQGDFAAANAAAANLETTPGTTQKQLDEANEAIRRTSIALHNAQVLAGQDAGEAIASITQSAKVWADQQLHAMQVIQTAHPELAEKDAAEGLSASFAHLKDAVNEAASANADFNDAVQETNRLNDELLHGRVTVGEYEKQIRALADSLHRLAEEAKKPIIITAPNQAETIKQFKSSMIGAEGTGPNQMGSSAAGFGQFTHDTFLTYFNRLFPDKAELSDAAKLNFRNVRAVADAVIDKATDDYVTVLKNAGQAITKANLYTVHLLGAPDARKFFNAAPGADTRAVFGDTVVNKKGVVDQNPFLKGTVAQAQAAIAKRIGDSSAAVSTAAVALAQAMQQEKERAARYLAEKDEAEERLIEARKGLALTAEQIWGFEVASAIAAHKHTDDQIAAQEVAGKLLPEEAKELRRINDERAKLADQLADQRLAQAQSADQARRNQNAVGVELGLLGAQEDQLRSQEGLARSSRERKELEDRLIDLQFTEQRIQLQAIIAEANRLKALAETTKNQQDIAAATKAEADAAVARSKLQGLPQQQANAHAQNAQTNASPLQDYFNSIPQTAADINDAFESIAANGLATFNDALASAIVNFTSLSDVARTVLGQLATDLIKFALQQIELHTIGAALTAASVATTTAAAAAAGAAWAGPAALASLATLGANAGPAAAAIASTVGVATVLGAAKAGGGRIFGPGSDTSDNILTPSSPGEFMIRAEAARSLGYDTLGYINQTGRLPSRFTPSNATASGGSRGGGFSQSDIGQLEGIVSRAVEAMPDIKLFPTLSPASALGAALGDPKGQRVMFDFLRNNSSTVKAQINRPGS